MWVEPLGNIETPFPSGLKMNTVQELADFNSSDVSEDYDFFATESGKLHLETQETFNSLFAVPNEWLKPEFVDHRRTDDHTPVNIRDGKIEIEKD